MVHALAAINDQAFVRDPALRVVFHPFYGLNKGIKLNVDDDGTYSIRTLVSFRLLACPELVLIKRNLSLSLSLSLCVCVSRDSSL
eukprot:COSAG06_NODE_14759_length_1109_cov_1.365403_1_plen_85_part_00